MATFKLENIKNDAFLTRLNYLDVHFFYQKKMFSVLTSTFESIIWCCSLPGQVVVIRKTLATVRPHGVVLALTYQAAGTIISCRRHALGGVSIAFTPVSSVT